MFPTAKKLDESPVDYRIRSTRTARVIFHRHGGISLSTWVLGAQFSLTRATIDRSNHSLRSLSLPFFILSMYNLEWWRTIQMLGTLGDINNLHGWRHASRPGAFRRWEQSWADAFGIHWISSVRESHRTDLQEEYIVQCYAKYKTLSYECKHVQGIDSR